MKPDKFDIKIQEAAAQNELAYDEQAWNAIEKLLDIEMPQKKKDRRKIFWLFFLLFIGTAGVLEMMKSWGNQENTLVSVKRNETNTIDKASVNILMKQKTSTTKSTDENIVSAEDMPESNVNRSLSGNKNSKNYSQKTLKHKIVSDEIINISQLNNMTESENSFHQKVLPGKSNKAAQIDDPKSSIQVIQEDSPTVKENSTAEAKEKDLPVTIKNNLDTLKKNTVPRPGNKFGKSFLINFSIGPDVSAVNMKEIGNVEPLYGAGIGYEINKRLTVRTGFYVVRKVYDAASSEYHPPVGFWNSYPDLKYIDADCKIYEVPLIINFNFNQTLEHLWFGSVGISSYFMKKEDYDYLSKTPSGQISYNSYNVRNQNQNYFSSVKISAGYEKKFGSSISLVAEPYIDYPLSGIGYGKVKLYSAGILFSVNVKPFSKK